jgi:ABC-2 type transport system permease protein
MLAAPRRGAILVGYGLSALTRAAFTYVVLFAVALSAGMQVGGDGVDLFGLIALGLMVNVASLLFSAGVALRFRSLQASPLMQTPTFLILFLAPVYVPADLLKDWIQAVAQVNPITALLDTGRSLMAGTPEDVGFAFAVAAGLIAVFLAWAIRGLRRAEAAGG